MKSTQDRAYAFIKEQIVNLDIKPGYRLRAQELARRLRVSRTPVREALGRLEQEGLVVRDGGWGYLVRPITFKEILDLFKIRETLEVQAALEAMPNLDQESTAALESALDEARQFLKKERFVEFRAANRRFHLLIAAATRNDLLHRLLLMIDDRIRVVGALHLDIRKDRAKEIVAENTAILAALRERDPALVTTVVLAHIRNSRAGLLSLGEASASPDPAPARNPPDAQKSRKAKRR